MRILLLLSALLIGGRCFAESGADVLLDELGDKTEKSVRVEPVAAREHRPTDAFQRQLFDEVRSQKNVPFEILQWTDHIYAGELTQAAHLWTAIQTNVPGELQTELQAAQLYLLWKLGLNQTFFDQWIRSLASSSYANSKGELALESLITPGLDSWLINNAIILTQQQKTIVSHLPQERPLTATLLAWGGLRDAAVASEVLPKLLPENKLTRLVSQTEVSDLVKKNDLKGAAKILRRYFEPAIQTTHNPEFLAKHDLSIARILYQAGQMNPAMEFYNKIPNQSISYLEAQEELAWVYLRMGDMTRLRGTVKALTQPAFQARFQPEVFLLRAVSDLKMCFYDQVERDLKDFSESNANWAKKIDQALSNVNPPAPLIPDEYTRLSELAVKNQVAELSRLATLQKESLAAAIPAVGEQKHWKDYIVDGQALLEEAKKREKDEYTRQWKSARNVLQEAIRKMNFVKVEYMSQIRQLADAGPDVTKQNLQASNSDTPVLSKGDKSMLNFSASTEIWPDELFKLRSAAQARCLKRRK
jgi:tetratricopeptide (TPR) repeat protein